MSYPQPSLARITRTNENKLWNVNSPSNSLKSGWSPGESGQSTFRTGLKPGSQNLHGTFLSRVFLAKVHHPKPWERCQMQTNASSLHHSFLSHHQTRLYVKANDHRIHTFHVIGHLPDFIHICHGTYTSPSLRR